MMVVLFKNRATPALQNYKTENPILLDFGQPGL
jgi:hypothetical protein